MELMGAVKGIMDLAIQFEFEGGGDGRTIGRTVGAVGACLGAGNNDGEEGEGEENTEVDLESLEFTIGDKDDEVLSLSSMLWVRNSQNLVSGSAKIGLVDLTLPQRPSDPPSVPYTHFIRS